MMINALFFLMSFLFFIAPNIQAQERYEGDCSDNECCYYEDNFYLNKRNFYVKIESGINFLQNIATDGNESSYKTGYFIGGSLGYRYCYGLCLEAEYAFRRNQIREIDFFTEGSSNHGHFQISSYMVNLLWEVPLSSWGCGFWNIQPMVGAGVGYDHLQLHSSNSRIVFDQTWERLSWQVMAGLSYPIFCNSEVLLEYKFHQGGTHFYNHSLGLGFVYKFASFLR